MKINWFDISWLIHYDYYISVNAVLVPMLSFISCNYLIDIFMVMVIITIYLWFITGHQSYEYYFYSYRCCVCRRHRQSHIWGQTTGDKFKEKYPRPPVFIPPYSYPPHPPSLPSLLLPTSTFGPWGRRSDRTLSARAAGAGVGTGHNTPQTNNPVLGRPNSRARALLKPAPHTLRKL